MSRGLKIFLTISLVIALGLTGICAIAYKIFNQALPTTEGYLSVSGLDQPAQIYRDGYHIPHILAESEYSLFFTQGFTTAQDRLWQMDLWRRYARGRLSNLFGIEALPVDSLMLTIGIGRAADRLSKKISSESRSIYQAYTDGVNDIINRHQESLPLEFIMMNYRPANWTISDCIAVYISYAWNLNTSWQNNLTFSAISGKVGFPKANNLLPGRLNNSRIKDEDINLIIELLKKSSSVLPGMMQPNIWGGGNAWAVSGHRSATGLPLLANDPHTSLCLPSLWYENHLFGSGFDVYGLSLPGFPGVIIGNNRHIAWSMTSAIADNLDFFFIESNSGNPAQYRYGAAIHQFQVRKERIPVRLDSARTIKIESSVHGPVLSNLFKKQDPSDRKLAMRWTGLEEGDDLLAVIGVNRASNWSEFRNSAKYFHAAPLQMIYADSEGHIGSQATGTIPIRSGNAVLPGNGNEPEINWKGKLPFNRLSSHFDPQSGFLSAAEIPCYPGVKSRHSTISAISYSVTEKLKDNEFIALKDLKKLQSNVVSRFAQELKTGIVPILSNKFSIGSLYLTVFNKFRDWDNSMHTGSSAAIFFNRFQNLLFKNIFFDEFGEDIFLNWLRTGPVAESATLSLIRSGKNQNWFDNKLTESITETKEEIILKSFREAVDELQNQYGNIINEWSWGSIHLLSLLHPLGANPVLAYSFNLGPFPMNGSGNTINAFPMMPGDKTTIQWGPSARMITDLGRRDNSLCVIPSGQSGQPLDEHYRDQLVLYREYLYHPVLTDTTRIKRSGMDLLILQPGETNGN